VDTIAIDTIGGIEGEIRDTQKWIDAAIDGVVGVITGWAIDNIYNPLDRHIRETEQSLQDRITGTAADVYDAAADLVHSETARRVAAVAGVAAVVAAIATEVTECLRPMCDQFGPKTDLSKILNQLKGLLGVLAGVELATLTEDDLEHFAHVLASVGTRGAEGIIEDFVMGGETIGEAGVTLLGDIGSAARNVLSDLGIPGL
jgi:hypothetical protein